MNYKELIDIDILYQTHIGEETFLWKLLSIREFKRFKAFQDKMHEFIFYNMVFERCFVGNVQAINQNIPAGIAITIGKLAFWFSGECQNETFLNDLNFLRDRGEFNSIFAHMRAIIFTAWPSYTPEVYETWSYPEIIKKFTEAEVILKKRNEDFVPLDLVKLSKAGKTKPKKESFIDSMKKDNKEINEVWGGQDGSNPLDMAPDDFVKMAEARKNIPKRTLAKKLDSRSRR